MSEGRVGEPKGGEGGGGGGGGRDRLPQLPPVLIASWVKHESLTKFSTVFCLILVEGRRRRDTMGCGIRPWRVVKSAQGDGDNRQFVRVVFTCLPLLL